MQGLITIKTAEKFFSYNITKSAHESTHPTHFPLETKNTAIVANSSVCKHNLADVKFGVWVRGQYRDS